MYTFNPFSGEMDNVGPSQAALDVRYVLKAGDTMTGPLQTTLKVTAYDSIYVGTNKLFELGQYDASAVNYLGIENAPTTATPDIYTSGADTNIDLGLNPKGSGSVNVMTSRVINVLDPTSAQDAATKNYSLSRSTSDSIADGVNYALGTTTGTKIGTATNQKLAFFNNTPIAKQGATVDLGVVLSNFGLRTGGTAYTITTSGATSFTGANVLSGMTISDASDVVIGTTTGTKIGTGATQKIGFYGVAPVVKPANIAAATGTIASCQTTINAMLLLLQSVGLMV